MHQINMAKEDYPNIDFSRFPISTEFPFPYEPEVFTPEESEVLNRYFTNLDSPVFAIKNLDQEVVGALLSKYSRNEKGIRRVFLDQFIKNEEIGKIFITDYSQKAGLTLEQAKAKAQEFYDTYYGDYGDESITQMGSVHICFEGVSQIAAKAIEDPRIGASFIEKSTRYILFDKKINDHYLFMEAPEIMNSEFREEYMAWNNALFDSYTKHYETARKVMMKKYPLKDQKFVDLKTGDEVLFDQLDDEAKRKAKGSYWSAIKSKTLDTIRVFLPTTTTTNLGAHLSGQAAGYLIDKMLSSGHMEVRTLGFMAYQELMKVSPSFLSKIDHKYGKEGREYLNAIKNPQLDIDPEIQEKFDLYETQNLPAQELELVYMTEDAEINLATAIIYEDQNSNNLPKGVIRRILENVKKEELKKNPDMKYSEYAERIIHSSIPDRNSRRFKLPRSFEEVAALFDMYEDWGRFRDLQRNRMQTNIRQPLSANDSVIPPEFEWEGMEEIKEDYIQKAELTKEFHNKLKLSENDLLVRASEYVTVFGNKVRFSIFSNFRQLAFFTELRTIEGGHPAYRHLTQQIAKKWFEAAPYMERLVSNINWKESIGLGRLKGNFRNATR